MRRYSLRSAAAYVLILAVFAFGVVTTPAFIWAVCSMSCLPSSWQASPISFSPSATR